MNEFPGQTVSLQNTVTGRRVTRGTARQVLLICSVVPLANSPGGPDSHHGFTKVIEISLDDSGVHSVQCQMQSFRIAHTPHEPPFLKQGIRYSVDIHAWING